MTEQAANELMSKVHFHFVLRFALFYMVFFIDCVFGPLFQVPGWNLDNEGGTLKLNRSWKVKSFTKGLNFFQAVAEVAEAEGLYHLSVLFFHTSKENSELSSQIFHLTLIDCSGNVQVTIQICILLAGIT